MVCCGLLAVFLAAPLWLLTRLGVLRKTAGAGVLAWRLNGKNAVLGPEKSLGGRKRFSKYFSPGKVCKSFVDAIQGLAFLVRNENNARVHLLSAASVIILGVFFGISASDWRWIVLCICMVFSAEALNTAIETICNLVSPEQNALVRISKDVAAGAVLMSSAGAATIGILTFSPYLTT